MQTFRTLLVFNNTICSRFYYTSVLIYIGYHIYLNKNGGNFENNDGARFMIVIHGNNL